jgi:cysteine dioxygenase
MEINLNNISHLSTEQEASMDSMFGLPDHVAYSMKENLKPNSEQEPPPVPQKRGGKCITFTCIVSALNRIFLDEETVDNWPARKQLIENVLKNTYLSEKEIQKYVFIDHEIPYTRNLVYTDNEHFSLILMCWNPNRESKIHDHPCDGCFVKTLSGSIKESRYHMEETTNAKGELERTMKFDFEYATSVNEVTYMDNNLGYHKIGPNPVDKPAMTLHLYTPPFKSCKVRNH